MTPTTESSSSSTLSSSSSLSSESNMPQEEEKEPINQSLLSKMFSFSSSPRASSLKSPSKDKEKYKDKAQRFKENPFKTQSLSSSPQPDESRHIRRPASMILNKSSRQVNQLDEKHLDSLRNSWKNPKQVEGMISKPSVELSTPIASFKAPEQRLQPKRLSVFSLNAADMTPSQTQIQTQDLTPSSIDEVPKDSVSASESGAEVHAKISKRLSLANKGWIPDKKFSAAETKLRENETFEKKIQKPAQVQKENVKDEDDNRLKGKPKVKNAGQRNSWFGFSKTDEVKSKIVEKNCKKDTKEELTDDKVKIGNDDINSESLNHNKSTISPQVKDVYPPCKEANSKEAVNSPRNSWWDRLGLNSSSTTLVKSDVSDVEVEILDQPKDPENDQREIIIENKDKGKEIDQDNDINKKNKIEINPPNDINENHKKVSITESIGNNALAEVKHSNYGVLQMTLDYMTPTWNYFFRSETTKKHLGLISQSQSSPQKLIEHNIEKDSTSSEAGNSKEDGSLIQHEPTPPPSNSSDEINNEDKPTYKEANKDPKHIKKVKDLPNLVLPQLDIEYYIKSSTQQNSFLGQIISTIHYYTGYGYPSTNEDNDKSYLKLKQVPKRIVVIGVHGWFPLKIYQKLIGPPTGTSEKFCDKMSEAVLTYLRDEMELEVDEDRLTKIPLSGEGKIENRLNLLYASLITNPHWMIALRDAEHIFIAAHSQGTPVSVLLLSRLLRDGLIDTSVQSTSLLCMAGITHGPFPFLKESFLIKYLEAEAARELFEFMNPKAPIVLRYYKAMRTILNHGVRVCAIASMVDQVVPLYSGIMHGFIHPNIYRSLYIDQVNYNDDFLTNLILFALELKNHQMKDHDLLLHLSDLVAGSLYSGTPGHSTIYEETKVYLTSVRWHFIQHLQKQMNSSMQGSEASAELDIQAVDAHEQLNPYFLPWIMRGLLDDTQLQHIERLANARDRLKAKFIDWEPTTKLLRELRFKLEPIKAKLMPQEDYGLVEHHEVED